MIFVSLNVNLILVPFISLSKSSIAFNIALGQDLPFDNFSPRSLALVNEGQAPSPLYAFSIVSNVPPNLNIPLIAITSPSILCSHPPLPLRLVYTSTTLFSLGENPMNKLSLPQPVYTLRL